MRADAAQHRPRPWPPRSCHVLVQQYWRQPARHPPAGGRAPRVPESRRSALPMTYVLPLRWHADTGLAELTDYLRWLGDRVELLVVDGSPPPLFARHAEAWRGLVRQLPPDPGERGLKNGKVLGVHTGVRAAGHEHVVIADDDVRYDESALERGTPAAGPRPTLVRPQNYFDPLPPGTPGGTPGGALLNRALGADYPGTLAVRRSTFLAMGGYDPDVLFENLELIRTVRGYGGTEAEPRLAVRPPAASGGRAFPWSTGPSGVRRSGAAGSPADRAGGAAGAGGRGAARRPGCCSARWPVSSPWPRRVAAAPAAPGCSRRPRRWRHHSGCWNAGCAAGWRSANASCWAAPATATPESAEPPTPPRATLDSPRSCIFGWDRTAGRPIELQPKPQDRRWPRRDSSRAPEGDRELSYGWVGQGVAWSLTWWAADFVSSLTACARRPERWTSPTRRPAGPARAARWPPSLNFSFTAPLCWLTLAFTWVAACCSRREAGIATRPASRPRTRSGRRREGCPGTSAGSPAARCARRR